MDDVKRPGANVIWRVRLFDGPTLEDVAGNQIRRFRSQRVGALLAYLSLSVGRAVPREELFEALWPEEEIQVVANRLRVALSSLRRQLEPGEMTFGTIIDVSDSGRVRLRAETVWCDTTAFEQAVQTGRNEDAARLVHGVLLPGYYDEWAITERERLNALREELKGDYRSLTPADVQAVPKVLNDLPRHRLPLYLTRFFGRERECQQLLELVAEHSLVTLTGPGGIGKTRLVVETAPHLPHACVFVGLADLPQSKRIAEAILQSLLILPQADTDPLEHLILVLQQRDPVTLILDNAEHLLDSVAVLSHQLLEAVPHLRLIITSRERLMVPGEVALPLSPLEPPPHAASPERLAEFPAVALFLDRARIARPDFVVSVPHADLLVDVCQRLEGMPLGLELAAARVSAQSLSQIAAGLTRSLTELKSGQRNLSPRHRSLRAAIESSTDLLPPEIKSFFAMLSIFQGGWTVEAARHVTGQSDAEAFLEILYLRSLVVSREDPLSGTLRYSFMETLRQFAAELLTSAERAECQARHADYFLRVAARVVEDDTRTFAALDADQENLLAALEWGGHQPTEFYWNGVKGAFYYSYVRGYQRRAAGWAETMSETIAAWPDARTRSRVRYTMSGIFVDLGRLEEATQISHQMRADCGEIKDTVGEVYADTIRGFVAENAGDAEQAVPILRESLDQARCLDDIGLLMTCLSLTSSALITYGAALGEQTEAGSAVLHEAESLARELLSLVRPYSRRLSLAKLLIYVASSRLRRGEEVYRLLKEAQLAALTLRTMTVLMYCFIHECQEATDRGLFESAGILYGAFLQLQEQMGYSVRCLQSNRPDWIKTLRDRIEGAIGTGSLDLLIRQGMQIPAEELVATRLATGKEVAVMACH